MTAYNYLLLDNANNIVNTIVYDPTYPYSPPDGLTLVEGIGSIGWLWNGTEAVNPNPPPPPSSNNISSNTLSSSKLKIIG